MNELERKSLGYPKSAVWAGIITRVDVMFRIKCLLYPFEQYIFKSQPKYVNVGRCVSQSSQQMVIKDELGCFTQHITLPLSHWLLKVNKHYAKIG